jgi:membrane protease YdiL (CAAX protease family)
VQNRSTFRPSPGSPKSWPADAFPGWPSLAAALGAVFVYVATLIVLLPAFGVTAQTIRAVQLTPPIVEAQVLGYVPILAYIAVVLPALARRPLGDILGPLGGAQALAGFGGALLMWAAVIVVGALQARFVGHQPTQTAVRLFENAHPGFWLDLMAVIAVTLAPFVEELIFRGFVFNALWRRFSFASAAIVSGILFGAAHGQVSGIAPLAAGGIVLAGVYARTGSLWSSMIAHGTFNAITLVLLLVAGIKT